jgi:hypothetical protein
MLITLIHIPLQTPSRVFCLIAISKAVNFTTCEGLQVQNNFFSLKICIYKNYTLGYNSSYIIYTVYAQCKLQHAKKINLVYRGYRDNKIKKLEHFTNIN